MDDVTVSNGLEWSPDGSRAYYIDTATHRVTVFDYETEAGLTRPRLFAEVPAEVGRPDGLTVDGQGGVWVAVSMSGQVWRYRQDGVLDQVIEVPTEQVTACTFGGPGLDQLYITTSQERIEPGSDPLAGALFRATPGVTGLPAREFAG